MDQDHHQDILNQTAQHRHLVQVAVVQVDTTDVSVVEAVAVAQESPETVLHLVV